MRLDNQDGGDATGEYMERSADLSGATTATFTFNYDGYGVGNAPDADVNPGGPNDFVDIKVSVDGGSTWTHLEQIAIQGSPTGSKSYQLENHITLTANVVVRFQLNDGFGAVDQYVGFDNVQVSHNGGPNNGTPMGQWLVEITTAQDVTDGHPGDDPTKASQLILVDQKTGDFTPVMQLSLPYDGLASQDGQTFYAVSGKKVYAIDTVAGTETLLHDHLVGDFSAMGFAGSNLQSFGKISDSTSTRSIRPRARSSALGQAWASPTSRPLSSPRLAKIQARGRSIKTI